MNDIQFFTLLVLVITNILLFLLEYSERLDHSNHRRKVFKRFRNSMEAVKYDFT